jgi:hypothetical protein
MRTPARAPINFGGRLCETRAQLPIWLLSMLVVLALASPVAAADANLYASFRNPTNHRRSCRGLIGPIFVLLAFLGQNVLVFSGTLVGPLMGMTSMLWLIMRNDAAIDPEVSWM